MPAVAQTSDRSEFPGRRVGGGTRGECMPAQPLVALNPASNLALTASEEPTVYFSISSLAKSHQMEFFLRDTDGNFVYETAFEAGETAEIVGITVPNGVLALEQDYQWYFSVVCDPLDRSQNMVLEGWLRRTSPAALPIEETSELPTSLELAATYEAAGLWGDAISTLVELRQTQPENSEVEQQWSELLQDLELDTVLDPETDE
ncbi:MAG: DUF928 domain-containing protein [Thainema sp.]